MKNVLAILGLLVNTIQVYAQILTKLLSFEDILNAGVYQTIAVKKARLEYSNEILEYENYKKSFLPVFSLSFNPINFTNSMKLLQNYKNGEYYNVVENYNSVDLGISVSQKIWFTGGTFSVNSSLNYVREFSLNNNSFSSVPFQFSYHQSIRGELRKQHMETEINELKRKLAEKKYVSAILSEQEILTSLYLDAYRCLMEKEILEWTEKLEDTLVIQAMHKLQCGRITKDEYDIVVLQKKSNNISLQEATFAYEQALYKLRYEINDTSVFIQPLKYDLLPEKIDENTVKDLVKKNNVILLESILEKKNAEYVLYKEKLANRFNADITLGYGTNQYANSFTMAYFHPLSRQTVSVSLSIPMFRWGMNCNKRVMAKNKYDMILLSLDKEKEKLDDIIHQ